MVPLISSGTDGPSGIIHLPRLWAKGRLCGAGRLPEDYYFATRGFDRTLLDALGIAPDLVAALFQSATPSYPEFEEWVLQESHCSDDALIACEAGILARDKPIESAARERAVLGLTGPTVRNGVLLNDLEDWRLLHQEIVAECNVRAIVPAISSSTAGPLGAAHLPRLWLTGVLRAAGVASAADAAVGLDRITLDHLGIDEQGSDALLASMPDYVQYEAWVRESATRVAPAEIAQLNEVLRRSRDEIQRTDLHDWERLHMSASLLTLS
jgi:hypothetical protein